MEVRRLITKIDGGEGTLRNLAKELPAVLYIFSHVRI